MHSVTFWLFPINCINSPDYLEVEIVWAVLLSKFWWSNSKETIQGRRCNDLKVESTEPSRTQRPCNPVSLPILNPLCNMLRCLDLPRPFDSLGLPQPYRHLHIEANSNALSLSLCPESLPRLTLGPICQLAPNCPTFCSCNSLFIFMNCLCPLDLIFYQDRTSLKVLSTES